MDTFLEILKFTIPGLLTGGIVWLVISRFMDAEENRRMIDLRLKNQQLFTPIRLQAYERIALLLERMTPVNLIQRVSRPGISAAELKNLLVNDINAEYNHNLSQQIYVSHQLWALTRVVKEQTIQLINIAYMNLPGEAKGIDLTKAIFNLLVEQQENPSQKALDFLNKEVHIIFTDED